MVATCRDCQAEVSRSAKACPQCGARKPWMGKAQWGVRLFSNWGMLIGLSAVLFVALGYCA